KKENGAFIWDFSPYFNRFKGASTHSLPLSVEPLNGDNIVMIFDDVHKCTNNKTLNGKLLLSCKNMRTIMLSAKVCDKNIDFGIFGMMLGLYKNCKQGKAWIDGIMRE